MIKYNVFIIEPPEVQIDLLEAIIRTKEEVLLLEKIRRKQNGISFRRGKKSADTKRKQLGRVKSKKRNL